MDIVDNTKIIKSKELWAKLLDNRRYEISSFGRLRQKFTSDTPAYFSSEEFPGYVMKKRNYVDQYHIGANITDSKGFPIRIKIAREMLRSFVGEPPTSGHGVVFRDGNITNLTLSNLFWGTKEESQKIKKSKETLKIMKDINKQQKTNKRTKKNNVSMKLSTLGPHKTVQSVIKNFPPIVVEHNLNFHLEVTEDLLEYLEGGYVVTDEILEIFRSKISLAENFVESLKKNLVKS